MKEKILEFLKQQEGFISGQRICDELGISRTAVWKYMNSLKKEGYEIESVTRKGYRLLQSPDLLTREAVLSCIKKGEIPGELCCFESIDSEPSFSSCQHRSGQEYTCQHHRGRVAYTLLS